MAVIILASHAIPYITLPTYDITMVIRFVTTSLPGQRYCQHAGTLPVVARMKCGRFIAEYVVITYDGDEGMASVDGYYTHTVYASVTPFVIVCHAFTTPLLSTNATIVATTLYVASFKSASLAPLLRWMRCYVADMIARRRDCAPMVVVITTRHDGHITLRAMAHYAARAVTLRRRTDVNRRHGC